MKKKQSSRSQAAAFKTALQALPPSPSTTMVKWDETVSAAEYVQEASTAIAQTEARLKTFRELSFPDAWHSTEIANFGIAYPLFIEAKFQLLTESDGLLQLLDRKNWITSRPNLSIVGALNARTNLKIDWRPPRNVRHVPPDFPLDNRTGLSNEFFRRGYFDTEGYGDGRPLAELMRFRNVPLASYNEHPSVRYVIYAIHSRYREVLSEIGRHITITRATRLEFIQDDPDGVRWTLA